MSIKKLDQLDELMIIMMEECGELIQECSKCIRKGEYDREQLKNEIADVQAMINIAHEFDLFSWVECEEKIEKKREKLKTWSRLINE